MLKLFELIYLVVPVAVILLVLCWLDSRERSQVPAISGER